MLLGSTQLLTEMITSSIYWASKGGRSVRHTNFPHSCADCLEMWEPQPPGTPGPVQGCNGIAIPLPLLLLYFQKI